MVQECYERASPVHNPPTFRTDVVHLSMNIVQVVHHGHDAETCTEQTCQDKKPSSQQLADVLSHAQPEVRTIITIDETAEDVIKRIVENAGGKPTKSKDTKDKSASIVPDFKYKALEEDNASGTGK